MWKRQAVHIGIPDFDGTGDLEEIESYYPDGTVKSTAI
jgi:hypothetical protein